MARYIAHAVSGQPSPKSKLTANSAWLTTNQPIQIFFQPTSTKDFGKSTNGSEEGGYKPWYHCAIRGRVERANYIF
jgi:hypothetical protein